MNVVRVALGLAALAAGGLTATLTLTGGVAESPTLTATLGLVVGLSWCFTGLAEWRRRPSNRTGPLMVCLGFAWFASQLEFAEYAPLFTVGLLLTALHIAFFAHVLLAFPTGRLELAEDAAFARPRRLHGYRAPGVTGGGSERIVGRPGAATP